MAGSVGSAVRYRTIGRGIFHCERCGGDRPYRHRARRRFLPPFGSAAAAPGTVMEHLSCAVCGTCYRLELLAVPTMSQMQIALLAGTTAAVIAMLSADGAAAAPGQAATCRAVDTIRAAGAPDFDEACLAVALARDTAGQVGRLRPAIEAFAIQLDPQAREWFLARVVQVGLADGALSDGQRDVAGIIARYLGLTRAMARAVIVRTEEAAQAG